jgi:hypothetical protein
MDASKTAGAQGTPWVDPAMTASWGAAVRTLVVIRERPLGQPVPSGGPPSTTSAAPQ